MILWLTIILIILMLHVAVAPLVWLASLLAGLPWLWRHLAQLCPNVKWTIVVLFGIATTVVFLAVY